jgi:hypothetical protein
MQIILKLARRLFAMSSLTILEIKNVRPSRHGLTWLKGSFLERASPAL